MRKIFSIIFFAIVICGIVWKAHIFSIATSLYKDEFIPAHLFNIENPNEIYMVIVNNNSNTYGIYPLNDPLSTINKDHAVYISSSPVDLQQYANKRVKFTGKFVFTNHVLKIPHNTQETFSTKTEAVEITSIYLAQ